MKNIIHIRHNFKSLLEEKKYVDADGVKTLELIGEGFICSEDRIFGTPNEQYIEKELEWYKSCNRNVYGMENPPTIWKNVADEDGNINSNYGWCIFTNENGNQYNNVIKELKSNKHSRRAHMIYTRPSMHKDFNVKGMSDFMCTSGVVYEIRHNKLHAVVQMRSNDVRFGFLNDYAWQLDVLESMVVELNVDYPELTAGDIIWNSASLHIYENQWYLVYHYAKTNEITITKKEFKELYKKQIESGEIYWNL
jgi:thymidylate synthase